MVWLKDNPDWDPSDLFLSDPDLCDPWCSSPLVFLLRHLTCMYSLWWDWSSLLHFLIVFGFGGSSLDPSSLSSLIDLWAKSSFVPFCGFGFEIRFGSILLLVFSPEIWTGSRFFVVLLTWRSLVVLLLIASGWRPDLEAGSLLLALSHYRRRYLLSIWLDNLTSWSQGVGLFC